MFPFFSHVHFRKEGKSQKTFLFPLSLFSSQSIGSGMAKARKHLKIKNIFFFSFTIKPVPPFPYLKTVKLIFSLSFTFHLCLSECVYVVSLYVYLCVYVCVRYYDVCLYVNMCVSVFVVCVCVYQSVFIFLTLLILFLAKKIRKLDHNYSQNQLQIQKVIFF
jgi:hypothetical protein